MPRDDTIVDTPAPPLASDVRRAWIAIVVALLPGLAFAGFGIGPEESRVASTLFVGSFFIGLVYLILTIKAFSGVEADTLAHWLRETTPRTRLSRFWLWFNGGSGVSWASQAAILAVIIVFSLLFDAASRSSPVVMITGVGAVVGAWLLIVASFAVQYARGNVSETGLVFPGDSDPVFSDYLYLAVHISTSHSAADVSVITPDMRRVITIHSVISFAFSTVIIAMLVAALISVAI